jgi:hypothetical protein
MNKKLFFSIKLYSLAFVLLVVLSTLPLQSADAAGLVPCGTGDNPPCTLCHLVIGIKGIYDWGIRVMTFFAIAVIVAMGIVYIVSASNSSMMTTAKNGIKTVLIGFVIMLGSWVIINYVMLTLANNGVGHATSWNTFTCDTTSKTQQSNQTSPSNQTNQTTPTNQTGGSGTGKCDTLQTGPCSVSNLQSSFGSQAAQASSICNAESQGNTSAPSNTDKCTDGNPFSIGLFQINLTVHTIGGLNCPSAFSGKNYKCTVTNQSLYDQCVSTAQDKNKNTQEAVNTYNQGGWNQWGANKKCGF